MSLLRSPKISATYREPEEGAKIQDIPDVSLLAARGDGAQGFWEVKGGWKYLRTSAGITQWPDLADTHVPAKIVKLMKDPGSQERRPKPVTFAAIQTTADGVKHRLMWNNNWLQLVGRSTDKDNKQILRMNKGGELIEIVLKNETANALFGEMN